MKYRVISLLCAAVMVGAGAIYLAVGAASLSYILPILTVSLWILTASQFLEARTAGLSGLIALLPTIAMGLAAAMATLAMIYFYIS